MEGDYDARSQLTADSFNIECGIDSTNWEEFIEDVVVKIVANRPAVIHVYTSDGDFEYPPLNADHWIQKHQKQTYFIATSVAWNENDLREVAALMQFELSVLWIQLVPKIDRNSIDSRLFYETIDKISLGKRESHSYECIGLIADGKEFIWENPKVDEVINFRNDIQRISQMHEINLQFVDKRGI